MEPIYDIRFVLVLSIGVLVVMAVMLVGYINPIVRYVVILIILIAVIVNRHYILSELAEIYNK